MVHIEYNFLPEDEQSLSFQDQSEIARFLAEFGGDLALDAVAMQSRLHGLMRDIRIQLVEYLVQSGKINPEAAEVTLENIDIMLHDGQNFTLDDLRTLLEDAKREHLGNTGFIHPDWPYAEELHVRHQAAPLSRELTEEEEEQTCRDADMYGVYDDDLPRTEAEEEDNWQSNAA